MKMGIKENRKQGETAEENFRARETLFKSGVVTKRRTPDFEVDYPDLFISPDEEDYD
jgi:hypothetical protein